MDRKMVTRPLPTESKKMQVLSKGILTASLLALITPSFAQDTYERLFAFGDSYADSGYNLVELSGGGGGYPTMGRSPEQVAANFPYVAFPYWMQNQLGFEDSQMINYAIGGSTTQPYTDLGSPLSGPYQMNAWGGRRFTERDLIALSFGGNDGLGPGGVIYALAGVGPTGHDFDAARAAATAEQTVQSLSLNIKNFVAAGARNILIGGFSDVSRLPAVDGVPHPQSLQVFGNVYYHRLQEELRPLALGGTRIFLLDETRIIDQMSNHLEDYGFSSMAYVGANSAPSIIGPDGLHLTTRGYEMLAKYMSNVVMAPNDFSLLPRSGLMSSQSFGDSIVGRLDAQRGLAPGQFGKAGTVSVYTLGGYTKRNSSDDSFVSGSDYRGNSVAIGAEFHISPTLLAGLALKSGTAKDRLGSGGNLDSDSRLGTGYLSYDDSVWFGDVLIGYGRHDLELDRVGVVQDVEGRTDAETFAAIARGGYLFNFGSILAGPFVGVEYQRSEVDGYRETGDPYLAFDVDEQIQKSLISTLGLQIRAPFQLGGHQISTYMNIAWRHQFEDSYSFTSTLQQSPLLPIRTEVEYGESRNHGVIGGGLSVSLSSALSWQFSGSSEFGRESGDGYQLGTSLNYSF